MAADVIYFLCALTSFVCAVLLFRSYLRTGAKLLFWSSICFAGLTIDNSALMFAEYLVYRNMDLVWMRQLGSLTGLTLLIYSLIWHTK